MANMGPLLMLASQQQRLGQAELSVGPKYGGGGGSSEREQGIYLHGLKVPLYRLLTSVKGKIIVTTEWKKNQTS